MKRLINGGAKCISCVRGYARKLIRYRKRREKAKAKSATDTRKGADLSQWEFEHIDLVVRPSEDLDDDDDDSTESEVNCRDLFCSDHGDRERYLLKWEELFSFAICVRFGFHYVFTQIETMNYFGPILTMSLSIILIIFSCIPVLSAFIFLGNFSKRYFIKMWDCVPIFKGLPYAIMFYSIPIQVYNINFCSMSLLYLLAFFVNGKIPWADCDFENASEDCLPLIAHREKNFTAECCDELRDKNCSKKKTVLLAPKYSTYDFFLAIRNIQYYIANKPLITRVATGKIICLVISYFIVFLVVVIGMKRYRGLLGKLVICAGVLMVPLIAATIILGPDIPSPWLENKMAGTLFMPDFWLRAAGHYIWMELPVEAVNLGSQSPASTIPTAAAIMLYVTIEVIVLLLTIWMCMSYKLALQNYSIRDYKCLITRGQVFLFVLLPDMISRWYLAFYVLVVYFAVLYIWGLATVIIKVTVYVDALAGQFPRLRAYRTAVTAGFCIAMLGYNLFLDFKGLFEHQYRIRATCTPTIKFLLTFTVGIGLFIYTPERIAVDYQFVYGQRLGDYFVYGIKLYIAAASILFTMAYMLPTPQNSNPIVYAIVAAPIPLGMIFVIFQYLLGYRETIIEPNPLWGPRNPILRQERAWFDPTHHFITDTSEVFCAHNCLRNSTTLKPEKLFWRAKRKKHEEEMNETQ